MDKRKDLINYLNLKLAMLGQSSEQELGMAGTIINEQIVQNRLNEKSYAPVDKRIQSFINEQLKDYKSDFKLDLPIETLILDQAGMARELSLPVDKNEYHTDIIESYRLQQGVLHNPKHDRRTTKGVFHVVEDGLAIPDDKKAVPKYVFAQFVEKAFNNVPSELKQLPFTATQEEKPELFVSLLLKPLVSPKVEGYISEKRMEVRFIVPANLVANLDFVENIFGNGGNPFFPENDSALNPDAWTGHTGCVILAPQLLKLTKKELGLPNISEATERQKRDGMCWEKEDELYNDGTPFKITCRDETGTIVTIITDNYFGYCKKEVKTQIGFSANLLGLAEEEHAGGALVFPSYNLGSYFHLSQKSLNAEKHSFAEIKKILGSTITVKDQGYAIDKNKEQFIYLPESAEFFLKDQKITWFFNSKEQSLPLQPKKKYILPNGYVVEMTKHPDAPSWRLVGTSPNATMCHKPCTVSGGGKSEISKSLLDATYSGPVFINNFKEDMDAVEKIINFDYSKRLIDPPETGQEARPFLDPKRSLGSVIKLLTPSDLFTDEYLEWLKSIPLSIKAIAFTIKRFYKEEWAQDWRSHFSVDMVNGESGHELKFEGRALVGSYLRVAKDTNDAWRTFKLRQDFLPAWKIQWEDDITASITVPSQEITGLAENCTFPSVKITQNCENHLFQRPDDAVIRGYDKQAEADLVTPGIFVSNFAPLGKQEVDTILADTVALHEYTPAVKDFLESNTDMGEDQFLVAPNKSRIYDGSPTKNPRYLQTRPDLVDDSDKILADIVSKLNRRIPAGSSLQHPVDAVLPGRRNNPSEPGIRPLAVYNPIHYQDLPEFFMDAMCSLTGKSPSTTGAGSEGALTKGPFNALLPVTDLNNALLSFIVADYEAFSTAAGYIGHEYQVAHDVSLLVPELWSRMTPEERNAKNLIAKGYLEKIEDFEFQGEVIPASRLGYRINKKFTSAFLGRIFDQPNAIFPEDMLCPEEQSLENYVDGIKNICEGQKKVAEAYFRDGGVEQAIPPLKAILHILVKGEFEGMTLESPELRQLFDRQAVLESDWYKKRLATKQVQDIAMQKKHIDYIENFIADEKNAPLTEQFNLVAKLDELNETLAFFGTDEYYKTLIGTIGLDPVKG